MSEAPTSRFLRVMTYPIYILPVRRFPRLDARGTIAKSDLPLVAQQLIVDVVRQTRLWRGEESEVALELIAHFGDGLEAGRSADELISSFGSTKTVARLIRRGKRRNRPFWWHVRRRLLQSLGAVLLVYIGLALLLVVRHPNPSVDYVAELNRPMLATPPGDRAWPIYRAAWTRTHMWRFDDSALYLKDKDVWGAARAVRPQDAAWPEAAAFLREQKPLLDAAREAGLKPSLGWELKLGSMAAMAPEDRAVFTDATSPSPMALPRSRAEELLQESSTSILMPYLSPMRRTANVLAADIRLAASEGDTDRVLADYRALTGMARQAAETPFIINELVSLGILSLADTTLMEINQSMPESLAQCRVDLLHAMAATTSNVTLNVSGEYLRILDTLQRVYSDNGHGDGTPTLDGLQVLTGLAPMTTTYPWQEPDPRIPGEEVARALAMPGAVAAMASRKEVAEEAERLYAMGQRDAVRPLWVKLHTRASVDTLLAEWRQSLTKQLRHPLLTMLMPSLNGVGQTADQRRALHEAAMVALALEAYRDQTDQYPATLADLVPHYLPTAPLDYSTGGSLRYKLVNGKPLLYGLGRDGVDDGGVWTDKKARWADVPKTGDWVLYPPVEQSAK